MAAADPRTLPASCACLVLHPKAEPPRQRAARGGAMILIWPGLELELLGPALPAECKGGRVLRQALPVAGG